MNRSPETSSVRRVTTVLLLTLGSHLLVGCGNSKTDITPVGDTTPSTTTPIPSNESTTTSLGSPQTIRCMITTQPGCDGLTDPTCQVPEGDPSNLIMGRDQEGDCVPMSYGITPANP